MQTQKPRPPIWLIIVYVLAVASILAWPFMALMSAFAFDAPGSAQNPAIWTTVIVILSYPMLPLICVPASFFAYRGGRRKLAYVLCGIGSIPLALLVLGILVLTVSSVVGYIGYMINPPKF